ncbi:protein DpdF [Kineococcus radiotolerans]|uniref:protein DpdF n=1 Tax=Kineococcus radiotolerans TaxID=131568 RepID=UPI00138AC077|nr:protein DpdF [Kineococcus radiotolerans]
MAGNGLADCRPTLPRPHRRLHDALEAANASPADLAVLLRHVLGWEDSRGGSGFGLRLTPRDALPDQDTLSNAGIDVTPLTEGRWLLQRRAWSVPGDPTSTLRGDPLREVYLEHDSSQRRTDSDVPADTFWVQTVGHSTYRTSGQGQAARSVVTAPPGSTVLLNLPTGTGKTSLALAPALLRSWHVGVSIVIVPTVVLALDQERRVQDTIAELSHRPSPSGRYAYLGEMTDSDKQAIREAIRTGEQRILYTSPEAFSAGLAPALFDAAESGHLRYLVIDEAHMVHQWGADFRPDFQALVGMQRALVARSQPDVRPVTVLMTGTLSSAAAQTLQQLFGDAQPVQLLSSANLRGEPEYFLTRWNDPESRLAALREVLWHTPRPAVVYVSTPEQVDEVRKALRTWGLTRHAGVSGRSSAIERQEVVRDWRGENSPATIDVVVATSAFGLGVDMPDVRTVIHACEPESLDRFYQEVGRGGRDGAPSMSIYLPAAQDAFLAESLSDPTILLATTAQGRWEALLAASTTAEEGRLRLDLDARPVNVVESGPKNRAWNLRLLTLLVRTGALSLLAEETYTERQEGNTEVVPHRYLRVNFHRELDWTAFEAERTRTLAASRHGLRHLRRLASGDRCSGEELHEYYTFEEAWGYSHVPTACRGCPTCRRERRAVPSAAAPTPPVIAWQNQSGPSPQVRLLMPTGRLAVVVDTQRGADYRRRAVQIVERLIELGFIHIIDLGDVGSVSTWQRLQRHANPAPVMQSYDEPNPWHPFVPTVILLGFTHQEGPDFDTWAAHFPYTVIITPSHNTAPGRPGTPWQDLNGPCISEMRLTKDMT